MLNWIMIGIVAAMGLAWFAAWAIVRIIKGMSHQIKIMGKIMRVLIELGLMTYVVWDIWL